MAGGRVDARLGNIHGGGKEDETTSFGVAVVLRLGAARRRRGKLMDVCISREVRTIAVRQFARWHL